MLAAILDILFPRRCVACGRSGWPFCGDCWPAVATFWPPWCERCGRPLEAAVERCADCPSGPVSWARSAYLYEGPVRSALMRLKFGGVRSVADAVVPAMARILAEANEARPPPGVPPHLGFVVSWVPLARGRRRSRGFDQAEILARAAGEIARLPVSPLLRRVIETAPQARRAAAERRVALSGAFRAVGRAPPRVALVDDVLTSGATAGECAGVLRRAGAVEVGVVTAARSINGPVPARCYNPAGLRPGSVVARGHTPGSRCQSQAKRPT
jgi:predicted amidophosphoribosyltransferase